MSQDNLTTQYVSSTYQRLLQLSDNGNYITDGTGSKVNLLPTTASWATYVVNGGSSAPGGTNTQIQFNSASLLSGSSNFSFNYVSSSVILSGSFDFHVTSSIIPNQAGRLHWNDEDGTLELGLKGGIVSSLLGQGLVTRVVNKTVPNIDLSATDYQVVVVAGAQGQRLAIKLAKADNDANSAGTLGLVAENIAKNQEGFVVTVGLLKNIDTTGDLQGETWNDGDVLYLSPTTAGAITNIKPQAPQHTVIIGYVEYAHQNNGKIYVKIDNGYEIDELHNVRITTGSLSTGDLLMYDSGSSLWKNSKILSGSYTLSGSLTTNDGLSVQTLTASFISASSITGSLFGIASSASLVRVSSSNFTNNTFSLTFVPYSANMDDYRLLQTDNSLTYNPNTGRLTLTDITANSILANNFSGTASWATQAVTASFLFGSVTSASYALTSSFAVSASWSANGVPGGSNRQIQFNNSGIFGGESNLTYNKGGSANNFSTVRLINGSPNPDPDTEATEAGLRLEDSSNQGWTHTFSAVVNCPDTASTTVFSLETSGAQPTLGATCTYTIVDVNDYSSIRTGQLYVSFVGDGSTYYLSDTNNFGGNRADPNSAIFVLDYNGTLGRVRLQNDSSVTLRVVINVTTFTIK